MKAGKDQPVDGVPVSEPAGIKLPGASAATIVVPAFLNSLPRWILSTRCEFQGFLQSILKNPGLQHGPTSCSALWPMPLPFPEVFKKGGAKIKESHWKRLICLQVAMLDWLVLGSPSASPGAIGLGRPLNARQWSVVRTLEHLIQDGNTPNSVDAGDMGRAASKVEDFQDCLAALHRAVGSLQAFGGDYMSHELSRPRSMNLDDFDECSPLDCGVPVGRLDRAVPIAAKPLIAQRLHFPEAPRFDPHPYFDEATTLRYDAPLSAGFVPEEVVQKPPHVQVRAQRCERVKLYKKLAAAKMIEMVGDDEFYPDYRSGLFAVVKDSERDRMVLDGRPANMLDKGQTKWVHAMANPAVLSQLYIAPDNILMMSGEDLKDFFYQFKVNRERTARNTLADKLTASEVFEFFGFLPQGQGPFYIGLCSLAMGDLCACEFAQCSHIGLCLQHSVCKATELLTLRGSVPRGLLQVGLVIDDLVVFEQLLRRSYFSEDMLDTESDKRIAAVRAAYSSVDLPFNPKKAFLKQTAARFWGIELDGDKGLLRCASTRLWPACVITMRICSLGMATIGLLEAVAGTWVSLLGVRRRLYCLMHYVFQPLAVSDQKMVIRLSTAMISELLSFVVLSSLSVVNLRAHFSDFVCATDASTGWMAAVRASLPSRVVQELSRHCLRKGVWTKLLSPEAEWRRAHDLLPEDEELPDFVFSVHPLWEVLARSLSYSTRWRAQVLKPVHINLLELKAYLREERNVCLSFASIRVPFGIDSQVCLGAVVKGRAASPGLNTMMKGNLAYVLGSDFYPLYMYYPSAHNRADGPTRDSEPALPDLPLPLWWKQLSEGDTAAFDVWLKKHGGDGSLGGDLPFHLIAGSQDIDVVPNARLRRDGFFSLKRSKCSAVRKQREGPVEVDPPSKPSSSSCLSAESLLILNSFSKKQVLFAEGVNDFLLPGALDLYSGKMGVAKSMLRLGCPWIVTFDWERSAEENLLDESLRGKVKFLLIDGAVLSFGAAPKCSSFSVAITPPIRTIRYPRGLPGLSASMRVKVQQGNSHNDFVSDCVGLCIVHLVTYWVENPDTSWWWRQKRWRKWRDSQSPHTFRCCYCRFGTAWKKATRVATDSGLAGVRMMCRCQSRHTALRGMHPTKRIPWTLVAQPYPRGFSKLLATAACVKAGWLSGERLNVAGCVRCSTMRVGEASHPGPPRRAPQAVNRDTLEGLPTQRPQTLALKARLLQEFLRWCAGSITQANISDLFDRVPTFLPHALRAYGDLMFQRGMALSNLRHLILACQRWKVASRPFMAVAWEIVERWEAQVPVNHRTPIPEVVVKAFCSLAWGFKWYSWVGATLLSFYGAGRVGEVLRTYRRDLILPQDNLEPCGAPCFLQLKTFKSRNRQPAKIQHMKVDHPYVSRLLTRIFIDLDLDAPLFGSTPYQFRKRWDMLVSAFNIGKEHALTPGGLRGGAAVYHYKKGRHINDVMWLMRVRAQSTLESYIQEVSVLNTIAKLSLSSRTSISKAASMFDFLLATCGDPGPNGKDKLG